MPRTMIGSVPTVPNPTIADEPGIGCMQEYISFGLPNGSAYLFKKDKEDADRLLEQNRKLWPAVVIFPSYWNAHVLYAQCTFPYRKHDTHNFKQASGRNNFLRPGRLLEFMREYNVAAVIVRPDELASCFYRLDDPRIEESLFMVRDGKGIHFQQGYSDKGVTFKPLPPEEPSSARRFFGRLFGRI